MSTKTCLRYMCCLCEEFRATKNEFDKTFICSCILYKRGIVIPDVTLITPDLMKSGEILPGSVNKEGSKMKITGCCLPYGESKYHDAVQVGAFSHQDGERVPLLRTFGGLDGPSNIIGHCILHDTTTGVMCDIHFNPEYIEGVDIHGWCSYNRIGAWVFEVKREPMLLHQLPSKFGNEYIVTHGRIKAVVFDRDCLEKVTIEEEE